MRRSDICLHLGRADRAELEALITNRNPPRNLVWRAEIMLATEDGQGTVEIMRQTGMSKPKVWRWQKRYLDEGGNGQATATLAVRFRSEPNNLMDLIHIDVERLRETAR